MSLSTSKLNPFIEKTSYEVRGLVYTAAQKLASEGREIIYTSVGNPHALGQQPLTFLRQVLALVTYPKLLDQDFPVDVKARAREYLSDVKSIGAYTDSRGSLLVRQQVADWLERRDNLPSSVNNIFLTDGASAAVRLSLAMLIRGADFKDGILVPRPQYPLYSAAIALLGGVLIPYDLCETDAWGLNDTAIALAIAAARKNGVSVRGLVFINPGNPTGQQLTESQILAMVRLCHREGITLLADEVYQDNVYPNSGPFVSARTVLKRAGGEILTGTQLITFHTTSKGALGECGLRGGMMELLNAPSCVIDQVYKLSSINLSPNVPGQIAMGVMLNPPREGDESYPLWIEERAKVLDSLARRADAITLALNSLPGISCVKAGSLYAFPKICLPPRALQAATNAKMQPDVMYCLELLACTGIATVPGSGFGQKDGTFHFRTTILVSEDKLERFVQEIKRFHLGFMKKYDGDGFTSKL